MKIDKLICALGRNGYVHKDLTAIKAGAKANGFVFDGPTSTPGFNSVVQAGSIVSVMLALDDGSIAFGDCVDVIFAGMAGRDPLFVPDEHLAVLRGQIAALLEGRSASEFRPLAQELDCLQVDGRLLHTAVRYGVSQALLHAVALAHRETPAQTIAREYGSPIATQPIPILVSVSKFDPLLLDRMILKRAEMLPHASFTVVETDLGNDGSKLVDYACSVVQRIREIGERGYRPKIHLDTYGTLGELFDNDVGAIAGFVAQLESTVAPHELLIESPVIARSRSEQIDLYRRLRTALRERNARVTLIVDEWCNTLEDIRAFGEAKAAEAVQIKAPDLGGLNNTIEAVLYCREAGMKCCLGGTANETDQSARISANVALATQPDFILGKPGLGGDEALMILGNEMSRTLALMARA